MSNIYNLFKFLEKKKGTETPRLAKYVYAPEELTDEELDIKGGMDLFDAPITSLPDNLKLEKSLNLSFTKITSLPNNLQVGGNLFVFNTPLSSIPDNLQVEEDLYVYETPLAKKYNRVKILKMILDKGGYVKGNIYV